MKRIQRKRTKGWKMPEGCIYVGRPTKWGNAFKVGSYLNAWGKAFISIKLADCDPDKIREIYRNKRLDEKITLENSIEWYELWLQEWIKTGRFNIAELRGKDLACFCPLDQPCHADVLLKLANL